MVGGFGSGSLRRVAWALVLVGCTKTEVLTPFADGTGDDGETTALTLDPTGVPEPDSTTADAVDATSSGEATSGTTDIAGDSGATTTSGSSSTGNESSSSTGVDAVAPEVVATDPDDLQDGVPPGAAISIEFSEAMDPTTVTTNVDATCSGTIQLSSDDFATCIAMIGPPGTVDDTSFLVAPAAQLASTTTYRIRVLDDVTDAAGNPMAAPFETPGGFLTRYYHEIVIDGVNDFLPEEAFATSTDGHTAYVAWDAGHVYLGFDSPDVAAGDGQTWVVAYLGGPMGTSTGVEYNTQAPALPFDARWHARWRADNTFTGSLEWDSVDWTPPGWSINPGDVYQSGTFVELRLSTIDLQSPVVLDLVMGILREEALDEASWAAMPEGAYVDGYDPDFAQFVQFDLTASVVPADYAAIP